MVDFPDFPDFPQGWSVYETLVARYFTSILSPSGPVPGNRFSDSFVSLFLIAMSVSFICTSVVHLVRSPTTDVTLTKASDKGSTDEPRGGTDRMDQDNRA